MASLRIIKRRIRSVQNISKITQAMQMVAALKMKRAQERGIAGRPYAEKITQVIADLAALSRPSDPLHPLLQQRPVKNSIVVHITPDRGLCGSLVGNLNRKTASFVLEQQAQNKPVSLVTVGRKGQDYMRRYDLKFLAEFSDMGDSPSQMDTLAISKIIIDEFTNSAADSVYIAYTQFVNTLVQKPMLLQILPIKPAELPPMENVEYIYEPNSAVVLGGLLPRFIEMQVYHSILESIASEQSARMVAMKAATDNAKELTTDLTLVYNKARQEAITKELLDITAGASALS
ncbi:MAG: ATP synthase F1 subunit gamma [Dehalococcoidales bacterium]|nr:ATP synthase F1 subunit gamma [Dehalococcoidales bacterium]